jgi:isocitrate dehydrogenase
VTRRSEDHPIIPFIEGDGTGPDIWRASVRVLDAAVEKAYGGKKKIAWHEVYAGEKAFKKLFDNWLPDETVEDFRSTSWASRGRSPPRRQGHPLAQRGAAPDARPLRLPPPGALVQGRALAGEGPQKVDMVIFRENTEDIYAGIEWEAESAAPRSSSRSCRTR